jgi:predicted N-formylglutamate amidohydrolase
MTTVRRDPISDARRPGDPLLGPDDPPPYEILNPRGRAPVVLLCDHASNAVPAALDSLGLAETELARHIAWDIGAARVTRLLSARLDAPAVLAGYSRLVIDCNRTLDDPQSILAASDGAEVPGNRDLSPQDAADRADACFWPYHRAAAAVIEGIEARGEVPAVLMVHSFTPVMNGAPRPWHVGILWERDGRMALPLIERLRARDDLCVGDNEPYSASSPHGYTMPRHAAEAGRPNVEFELRQDLVADDAGAERWAVIVAEALEPILADPGLYRRWP